jgi:choline dehydrogenase-like flavoprotein
MTEREQRSADLRTLVDLVVPADEFASAGEAGGLDFLQRYLAERPDLRARLDGLLAAADPTTHPDWDWFAGLVNGGFYADPDNGGNAGAVSWRMVGWTPEPAGGWSRPVPVREAEPRVVTPDRLAARYDAVVIGSGAGGGVAACLLAESGRRVLVVEAGSWPTIAELSRDQLRNPRSDWGLLPLSGPVDDRDLRVLELDGRVQVLRPYEPGWANNAMTAGGGTRVYGAQAWRFEPRDLTMASTYGVPDGSALADWPITYDDLERYYSRADRELGVSGSSAGETMGRSRPYPMPPVRTGPRHTLLREAAERLGWGHVRVPLLINSEPYGGRAACEGCRMCVGFACPVDAKNGSQNTLLPRAFASGRAEILLQARAERLVVDGRGQVVAVALVGRTAAGELWRAQVGADEVVVSAGAVESARLLLNSAHDAEPTGLGNRHDQVGRHLQGHVYGGAVGLFDDVVEDLVGPGPTISTHDFRHGVDGLVGGGVLVDEFIPLPANVYRSLSGAGLIPRWGAESKRGMRDLLRRSLRVMGPIQEVTSASSRVRLDPEVRDAYGIPVPRLSGSVHACDTAAQAMLAERAVEWLTAAGAHRAAAMVGTGDGPSAGQHQAGTCRMGADPATSVVDPWCRVWGHDNVRVVDASVHVTNGGVNPVLTVFANAYRVLDQLTS